MVKVIFSGSVGVNAYSTAAYTSSAQPVRSCLRRRPYPSCRHTITTSSHGKRMHMLPNCASCTRTQREHGTIDLVTLSCLSHTPHLPPLTMATMRGCISLPFEGQFAAIHPDRPISTSSVSHLPRQTLCKTILICGGVLDEISSVAISLPGISKRKHHIRETKRLEHLTRNDHTCWMFM